MFDTVILNLATLFPVGLHVLRHDRKELCRLLPLILVICVSAGHVIVGHIIYEVLSSKRDFLVSFYAFYAISGEIIRILLILGGLNESIKYGLGKHDKLQYLWIVLVIWSLFVVTTTLFVWILFYLESNTSSDVVYPMAIKADSIILVLIYSGVYMPPFVAMSLCYWARNTFSNRTFHSDMSNAANGSDYITCSRCSSVLMCYRFLLIPLGVSLTFVRQGKLLYAWWNSGILELYSMEYCTMPGVYCLCLIHIASGIRHRLGYK